MQKVSGIVIMPPSYLVRSCDLPGWYFPSRCHIIHDMICMRHLPTVLAVWLLTTSAWAADPPAATKPKVVILCADCGIVHDIRRIERPVAPERETLPSLAAPAQMGGTGNATQPVPLFSFGRGGAQRVQRDPGIRNSWEITVRYDSGQFGFITQDTEPDLRQGDRVRHVENTLELMVPPAAR